MSGCTVLISLAGLFLIDSKTMRSMAVGAMVVVAIAVLGATTLLPALIARFGDRLSERGKIMNWVGAKLAPLRRAPDPNRAPFWTRRKSLCAAGYRTSYPSGRRARWRASG